MPEVSAVNVSPTLTVPLMLGAAPGAGLNELFQRSLGNADFIWICEIVILIGVLCRWLSGTPVAGDDALDAAWFSQVALNTGDLALSLDVAEVAALAFAEAGETP